MDYNNEIKITMNGTFYGLGVGPGDPELLTVKAVNILRAVDVIAVPESKKEMGSTAMEIAQPYLKPDVEILTLTFPMIRDVEAKNAIRRDNALKIAGLLKAGRNVAFLTLGDPMLYSTYLYLLEHLSAAGIEPVSVPGIYSFSAISNLLNLPLVKGDESLALICEFNVEKMNSLQSFQTVVCMKVSAYSEQLFTYLEEHTEWDFVMVTNAGKESQAISDNSADLKNKVHYFSTAILTRK